MPRRWLEAGVTRLDWEWPGEPWQEGGGKGEVTADLVILGEFRELETQGSWRVW